MCEVPHHFAATCATLRLARGYSKRGTVIKVPQYNLKTHENKQRVKFHGNIFLELSDPKRYLVVWLCKNGLAPGLLWSFALAKICEN